MHNSINRQIIKSVMCSSCQPQEYDVISRKCFYDVNMFQLFRSISSCFVCFFFVFWFVLFLFYFFFLNKSHLSTLDYPATDSLRLLKIYVSFLTWFLLELTHRIGKTLLNTLYMWTIPVPTTYNKILIRYSFNQSYHLRTTVTLICMYMCTYCRGELK